VSVGSAAGGVERLHIDTDPGLDDLLAIALALASREASVHSLSTVAGNAGIDAVTENAQRFLALAGARQPIGRGAGGPLELSAVDGTSYHGADGRRGITIPAIDRRPLPTAAEVLRRGLKERAIDRIVALGPLTNLAQLIDEERSLFDDVEIIWMGGTLTLGNVTSLAEFNCYADPASAARVLAAGLAVRVVGLDVTRDVHVRGAAMPAGALGRSAMGRVLEAVLSAMMDSEEPLAGERRATLHDPCALLAALPLDLFRWEEKSLTVVVDEGHERGRLLECEAGAADAAPPVRYAVEVNTPEVVREFWSRLAAFCGVELQ
jgi:inosine-uridine nucleoside N-ribohydrolase